MEQDGSNHWERNDILARFTGKMKEWMPSDYMGWGLSQGAG
jgi:hypothetical protein